MNSISSRYIETIKEKFPPPQGYREVHAGELFIMGDVLYLRDSLKPVVFAKQTQLEIYCWENDRGPAQQGHRHCWYLVKKD
jgi:hypothetical protein